MPTDDPAALDAPAEPIGDAEILCRIETICDEF
jgi:hypothetical protein